MLDTDLPEQNLFLGRGLILIWLIDPVPYQTRSMYEPFIDLD